MGNWQPIETLDPDVALFLAKEEDGDIWLIDRWPGMEGDGRKFYVKENGCGCCSTMITAVSWCRLPE